MLTKMVASALFAGLAAGLLAVLLQFAFVQPLLLQAEKYESGELAHFESRPASHERMPGQENAHEADGHTHAASGLDSPLKRDFLSLAFSVFLYVGSGMILVAAFAAAQTRGIRVTARSGLLWGLAGFLAVHFAPAIGLAPEVPGNAAADLGARQVWWYATVGVTALGIALIAFGRNWIHWGLALVAILLPHVIGAPHPTEYWGAAPPELAAAYAVRALGVSLAAWLALGSVAGYFWNKGGA